MHLARLNPFARLPNGRAVWAWGMYDLANQSFQLLINTLLFAIFVKQVIVIDDPAGGTRLWVKMVVIAQLLVVVLSPVLGALADVRAWKREFLLATGVVCSLATASLALLQPGDEWLALGLFVLAAVSCSLGENFLASFLPQISTRQNVGYISALGWTMSYMGAIVLLGVVALFAFVLKRDAPAQFPPMFVFAGVWFAMGMLPAVLYLRERARPLAAGDGALAALRRLAQSAAQARRFRQLGRFLLIFFLYSMGTNAMIYFLGQIGDQLGFGLAQLVVFALVMALTAGAAAAATARFQDRLGHRPTIMIFLAAWCLATTLMGFSTLLTAPWWAFWAVATLTGVALGGVGTASRALVGAFTPEDRAAEFFGLWGLANKLSIVAGVALFGVIATNASAELTTGHGIACFVVAGLFAAGLVLLRFVDVAEGMASAAEKEGSPE